MHLYIQEITRLLWNKNIDYRVHKNPDPIHIIKPQPHFFETYFITR